MRSHELSFREDEIVDLAIEGMTNEAIAFRLGLSIGTVNTYWLRIRMKVGGIARTDSVAKVIGKRALASLLADEETARRAVHEIAELHHTILLLKMALSHTKASAWVTDRDLNITLMADAESPVLEEDHLGRTVYDIFGTRAKRHPAISAHFAALKGKEKHITLNGDKPARSLSVVPCREGEEIAGCVSLLAQL